MFSAVWQLTHRFTIYARNFILLLMIVSLPLLLFIGLAQYRALISISGSSTCRRCHLSSFTISMALTMIFCSYEALRVLEVITLVVASFFRESAHWVTRFAQLSTFRLSRQLEFQLLLTVYILLPFIISE